MNKTQGNFEVLFITVTHKVKTMQIWMQLSKQRQLFAIYFP